MAKQSGKGRHAQTAAGARVARERAARRRAAREQTAERRAAPVPADGPPVLPADESTGDPQLVEIAESDLMNEVSVLATLVAAGLARHHSEARRLHREMGVEVNGEPVLSDKAKLCLADVKDGVIRLSLGGSRHVLLKPA